MWILSLIKHVLFFTFDSFLSRQELDHLDTPDKYPEGFLVTLNLTVATKEKQMSPQSCPWNKLNAKSATPKLLFFTKEEYNETASELGESLSPASLVTSPD